MNFALHIRAKLYLIFLTILVISVILVSIVLNNAEELVHNVKVTAEHPVAVVHAITKIEIAVTRIQNSLQSASYTRDKSEIDIYLKQITHEEMSALEQIAAVRDIILGEEGRSRISKLRNEMIGWRNIRQEVQSLLEEGDNAEARRLILTTGTQYVGSIIDDIRLVRVYAEENSRELRDGSIRTFNRLRNFIVIAGLLGFAFGLIMINTLLNQQLGKVRSIIKGTQNIANGDFSYKINIPGHDELSEIADIINSMSDKLSESYKSLEEMVEQRTKELSNSNKMLQAFKDELEIKVVERTSELHEKVGKLDRSQMAMLYMVEDLNKTSKSLENAQEELVRKEKLATLGQLSGSVGHELRNPLGVISNAIYYLKTVLGKSDETVLEYLEIIKNEVVNSERIISDLLDFSRSKPIEKKEVSLDQLIQYALERYPVPDNIALDYYPDSSLPSVYVDPDQINQVLENVISNAYQAIAEKGTVSIKTASADGLSSISVSDNGCGIKEDNMTKLFEPLFTTKARGIGLGLTVSKNLLKLNGGKFIVSSEEGKGTTFEIFLPTKGVDENEG